MRKLRCVRGRKRDEAKVLVERLERELAAAEQILAQTDLRLTGQRSIPNRRVSLVDPDARPSTAATRAERSASATRH